MSKNKPAFPSGAMDGLTKREYAAIHILAGSMSADNAGDGALQAMDNLKAKTPVQALAKVAVILTDALFAELDNKGGE
jgi:hypothetical protein